MTHLIRTHPSGRTSHSDWPIDDYWPFPALQRIANVVMPYCGPSEIYRKLTSGQTIETKFGYTYHLKREK